MPPEDPVLRDWWPTTQSLDLVRGTVDAVADAVATEFRRFAGDTGIATSWEQFADLGGVFASAPHFASVVTFIAVLPTRSEWTVLWNNSLLCDGYDSLCWCLTHHHRLTTMHWSTHDATTTFQPGTVFTHRAWHDGQVEERSVGCTKNDRRWSFVETGRPLREEDLSGYRNRRKQDRLGEASLMRLLQGLGARPWSHLFYAVPDRPALLLSRSLPPAATVRRSEELLIPRSVS